MPDLSIYLIHGALSLIAAFSAGLVVARALANDVTSTHFGAAAVLSGVVALASLSYPSVFGAWALTIGWTIVSAAFTRAWWRLRGLESD